MCGKLLIVAIAIISIIIMLCLRWRTPPPVPKIPDVDWSGSKEDSLTPSKRSYKIAVPAEVISCLKERLRNSTLTPPLQGVGFRYGFNTDYLKHVINYWVNEYDWTEREKLLNSVPHYLIKISGLNIHYIHIKPTDQDAKARKVLPLLLLHGWPGSVKEFYKVFPLLTKPCEGFDFIFEVIAPSLPGYGFSEAASVPGLGAAQISLVMKKLMNAIGFQKFYVQGGDWGAIIAMCMATLYPESLLGLHSNMCVVRTPIGMLKLLLGSIWPSLIVEKEYQHRLYPLWNKISYLLEESGYLHLQATKPDTCGVALQNSPAGLAAYILEKFSTWTNKTWRDLPDGGLGQEDMNIPLHDLLDNVMIYWATGSITTSMRLYSETLNKSHSAVGIDSIPTNVPTVCAAYPNELAYSPETVIREKFTNLLYQSHPPKGGHFAAFEQPEIFADDVWKGVNAIEGYWKKKGIN